jgi:hypothetical protein
MLSILVIILTYVKSDALNPSVPREQFFFLLTHFKFRLQV